MRIRLLEIARSRQSRQNAAVTTRPAIRRSLAGENLEVRQLLAASLAPITGLIVPALQGFTQSLDGSATTDAQRFSATSSNPDVAVSIVSTTFWNVGVSYTDPNNAANDFSGTLAFGLFGSLTPNTVKMITQFTNDGYYVNSGRFIWRVASNFAGTTATVVQGGAANAQGNSGSSGQPNTPFANENLQQLAPTGIDQIFMANAGGTNTNDAQFFIASAPLNQQLGYLYTNFGQLVSGAGTLAEISSVPVGPNYFNEISLPANPITITSTSLSAASSNGVLLIDTTQARPGETAAITVTANDLVDGTQTQQAFPVTVGAYAGTSNVAGLGTVNFKPYARPVATTTGSYSSVSIQLAGQATFPAAPAPAPAYVVLSTPAHGTISNFNPAAGTVTYTPTPGFLGTDSFTYVAYSNGPNIAAGTVSSNPVTVTITVNQGVVTLNEVDVFTNRNHKVTRLELIWSGPLTAALAKSKAPFRLATANRFGSFTGPGSGSIAIKKVRYDGNAWTVTLTPGAAFLKSQKVQLLVHGNGSKGLKDIFRQYIAGTGGQPGTDSITIL